MNFRVKGYYGVFYSIVTIFLISDSAIGVYFDDTYESSLPSFTRTSIPLTEYTLDSLLYSSDDLSFLKRILIGTAFINGNEPLVSDRPKLLSMAELNEVEALWNATKVTQKISITQFWKGQKINWSHMSSSKSIRNNIENNLTQTTLNLIQ